MLIQKKGMEDRKKPYLPGESIAIGMSAAMNERFSKNDRVGLCGQLSASVKEVIFE
jgi:hypothetical protein